MIPTAEEILNILIPFKENVSKEENEDSLQQNIDVLKSWVKLHVVEALTEASKTTMWREEPTMQGCKISFVKHKILNAYNLKNIK